MIHNDKTKPYNNSLYRQVHMTYFLEHDPNSGPISHHKALIKALEKGNARSKCEVQMTSAHRRIIT
jgi:hypothetical protein